MFHYHKDLDMFNFKGNLGNRVSHLCFSPVFLKFEQSLDHLQS